MPHVSRRKLPQKVERELVDMLSDVLATIDTKQDMLRFLSALLTPTEIPMVTKRLAMIVLIKEGLSDSEIADTLHLTRITVAKMRLFFEARGEGFQVALRKLQKLKRDAALKKLLISLARYSIRAAGGYVKPTILD